MTAIDHNLIVTTYNLKNKWVETWETAHAINQFHCTDFSDVSTNRKISLSVGVLHSSIRYLCTHSRKDQRCRTHQSLQFFQKNQQRTYFRHPGFKTVAWTHNRKPMLLQKHGERARDLKRILKNWDLFPKLLMLSQSAELKPITKINHIHNQT